MKEPITIIPGSRFWKNFKDGVADAIIIGCEAIPQTQAEGYKDGYEFGMTLHERLNNADEDELPYPEVTEDDFKEVNA